MASAADMRWMALALTLGARGQGQVWPNPAVGCVIVQGARVVGRGWTQAGGRPHAETMALAQAGTAAKGAVAYVTLEPCSHHGKTPPCAQALIDAGIVRVVVALGDPDPRVNGAGLKALKDAKIELETGVLEDRARQTHRGFLYNRVENRPLVTLKLATSLDGRIATASGESQWITGPEARRYVHAMRARYDAVMVGGGTARADLPSLTVRGLGLKRQPVRIIVSRHLDLPETGPIADETDAAPVWLLCAQDCPAGRMKAWADRGAEVIPVASDEAGINMAVAMRMLAEKGLTRILCEGGGGLAASLLKAGSVDQLAAFSAGKVLGADGTAAIGALGLDALSDAPVFALSSTRQIGADSLSLWDKQPG